jgi:hypothetical protein
MTAVEDTHSWWPTRKWFAVAISGLFTIASHAAGSGGWDSIETAEVLTLSAGLASSYLTPNDDTLRGLRKKRPPKSDSPPPRTAHPASAIRS